MKFILGTKVNMIQYFSDDGKVHPATVISAGPVTVTQVKNEDDKNKYNAVQVGFGEQKESRLTKAEKGHLKDIGSFKHLKEFRVAKTEAANFKKGDKIDVSIFGKGDEVEVSGVSKGKGFQGVIKRHGFHGGPRSHGQKHSERAPGSIGGGLRTHVPKGMRMGGRMGSDRITVKHLTVLEVDKDNNTMLISGALPGRRGTLVEVRS